MYSNTGKKIKGMAGFSAFCGILVSIIIGIAMIVFCLNEGNLPLDERTYSNWFLLFVFNGGLIVGIGGSMYFYQKYLMLAAFGELVEETTKSSACLEDIRDILIENSGKS